MFDQAVRSPFSGNARIGRAAAWSAVLACALSCAQQHQAVPTAQYQPQRRDITVTMVPLLVKEAQAIYPFLKPDFAKGGVLAGKEVYAFSPSTVTVIEGDTIVFTFVNPEDDSHSFILPDFAIALPGQKTTTGIYVARRAGVYPITCNVPSHTPMMSGQLVVLAPGAVATVQPTTASLSPVRP
jgi:plastocyanin